MTIKICNIWHLLGLYLFSDRKKYLYIYFFYESGIVAVKQDEIRKQKQKKLDGKFKEGSYVPDWTNVLSLTSATPSKMHVAFASMWKTNMVFGDICIIIKSQ